MVIMSPRAGQNEEVRSFDRELRRGSLELVVLHLLSSGEA